MLLYAFNKYAFKHKTTHNITQVVHWLASVCRIFQCCHQINNKNLFVWYGVQTLGFKSLYLVHCFFNSVFFMRTMHSLILEMELHSKLTNNIQQWTDQHFKSSSHLKLEFIKWLNEFIYIKLTLTSSVFAVCLTRLFLNFCGSSTRWFRLQKWVRWATLVR